MINIFNRHIFLHDFFKDIIDMLYLLLSGILLIKLDVVKYIYRRLDTYKKYKKYANYEFTIDNPYRKMKRSKGLVLKNLIYIFKRIKRIIKRFEFFIKKYIKTIKIKNGVDINKYNVKEDRYYYKFCEFLLDNFNIEYIKYDLAELFEFNISNKSIFINFDTFEDLALPNKKYIGEFLSINLKYIQSRRDGFSPHFYDFVYIFFIESSMHTGISETYAYYMLLFYFGKYILKLSNKNLGKFMDNVYRQLDPISIQYYIKLQLNIEHVKKISKWDYKLLYYCEYIMLHNELYVDIINTVSIYGDIKIEANKLYKNKEYTYDYFYRKDLYNVILDKKLNKLHKKYKKPTIKKYKILYKKMLEFMFKKDVKYSGVNSHRIKK